MDSALIAKRKKSDMKFFADACKEAGITQKYYKSQADFVTDPLIRQVRNKLDLRLYNYVSFHFIPKLIPTIVLNKEVRSGKKAREIITAYLNAQVREQFYMYIFSFTYLPAETKNIRKKLDKAQKIKESFESGKFITRTALTV
jgi:hypothetical protein